MVASGGHSHVDLRSAELGQRSAAVVIHHPGAHEPGSDPEVVVHCADGSQQGRLRILSEERIHAGGVARGSKIQSVHRTAGCEAGAGYVGRNPS